MADRPTSQRRLGLNASWAMAVGGMVGGGIFSVLGVVYQLAGSLTWLSFLLGGGVALVTARSYAALGDRHRQGGGAFTYLRHAGQEALAGTLAWILILAYILTIAVYAFTFGHYLAELAPGGAPVARLGAVTVVILLVTVNAVGTEEAAWVAIATVYAKLLILLGLAAAGLWMFDSSALQYQDEQPGGLLGAIVGAGAVFMAYEGFQLLAYNYEIMHRPRRTLRLAMYMAVVLVTAVYIAVALAAASLTGAPLLVAKGEVALAAAGEAAWGAPGKVVVSVGALLAAASAINATLFATSRLVQTVAGRRELPPLLARENGAGAPVVSVVLLGAFAALLAVVTALGRLVEAASLVFLVTFGCVNLLVAFRGGRSGAIAWVGAAACTASAGTLVWRIATSDAWMLVALAIMLGAAVAGRTTTAHLLARPEAHSEALDPVDVSVRRD